MGAYLRIISFIGLLAFAAVILIGLLDCWLVDMHGFHSKTRALLYLVSTLESRSKPGKYFQVFFPVAIWMQSHLSSYLHSTAIVGHLLQAKNIYQVNF